MTEQEMIDELSLLKQANNDILSGRVQKFHKGDTTYTMLDLGYISKRIKELKNEISIIKTETILTRNDVCRG